MLMAAIQRGLSTDALGKTRRFAAPQSRIPDNLSRCLAKRITNYRWNKLPSAVREHAKWSFVNFLGCAIAGSDHDAVKRAGRALHVKALSGESVLLGRLSRTMPDLAALLNCIAASVHAFDDTHADSIVHASSVVGSAVIAMSGSIPRPVSGQMLLEAFACGVELMCRLSKAISAPRAQIDRGWSQSGLTGSIGSAAACSKLMGASRDELLRSMGIAASLASGLRVAHGTMTMHLVPANAAHLGVQAASLSRQGFTGPVDGLEGRHGFLRLFCSNPEASWLIDDWDARFEIRSNMFKAYPCGIVIHPVIDACLRLHQQLRPAATAIKAVQIVVSPAAAKLADRMDPTNEFQAQVSLQHWASAVLLHGKAGIAEGLLKTVQDPTVRKLRTRCAVRPSDGLSVDAADVRVTLRDGSRRRCVIGHCKGSVANPLTKEELTLKFLEQASRVLGVRRASHVLMRLRGFDEVGNVNRVWRRLSRATRGRLS